MSHYPFPWSTHPQVRTSVFNAYGVKVATTTGPNAADNAALIARATSLHHELVAALEAAQAHLLKYTGGFAANKEEATVFDKMRSALQKAKQVDKP